MSMKIRWGKSAYGMMGRMRKVAAGHYQLKWQGDVVDVKKLAGVSALAWYCYVNGDARKVANTLNEALDWVSNVWGNEPVMTYNMLNRAAGEFPIARKDRGGCCDPATERYHCM